MEIHNPLMPVAMKALDALSLNQKLLATNIANANAKGFVSARVEFSSYMDSVLAQNKTALSEQSNLTSFIQQSDNKVNLDLELAAMSENLQRYKAVIDVLDRQAGIMRLAMKGRSA